MPWTPPNDQRHEPEADAPDWSERWSFSFIDPRQKLHCTTRLALLPNSTGASVAVTLSRSGRPLYHRQLDGLALPGGDLLSGITAAGLTVRALSIPRSRFLVSFSDPACGFSFDFDWHGIHVPVDSMDMHSATTASGLYGMRIEQFGRIAGRMTYRKRTFDLVGLGPRVHAVTETDWETTRSYDVASIAMNNGLSFGLGQVQHGNGLLQVPWMWTGEKLVPLSKLRLEKRLGEDGRCIALRVHVADGAGKTLRFDGTRATSMTCFIDGFAIDAGYYDFVGEDGGRGIGSFEAGALMGDAG